MEIVMICLGIPRIGAAEVCDLQVYSNANWCSFPGIGKSTEALGDFLFSLLHGPLMVLGSMSTTFQGILAVAVCSDGFPIIGNAFANLVSSVVDGSTDGFACAMGGIESTRRAESVCVREYHG